MKGYDMNKKAIIAGICANVFVLVKLNSKLNQTKKVTEMTADLLTDYLDMEEQKEADETFEEIVDNYDD
jgi:hypothetical protein